MPGWTLIGSSARPAQRGVSHAAVRPTRFWRVLNVTIVAIASLLAERGLPAQSPAPGQEPNVHRDVAPILYANCVSCHGPDGIAPMALTTFAAAKAYAARIREVTVSREMPPWYADPQHGSSRTHAA